MNSLEMVQEYASKMENAIDCVVEKEFGSAKPNRELIEFLTAQSMAFGQMSAFTEWLELKMPQKSEFHTGQLKSNT